MDRLHAQIATLVESRVGQAPERTFDAPIKVEHILRYPDVLPELAEAGCAFVVSAFESVSNAILRILDKGHTAADASAAVIALRAQGIEVRPSWLSTDGS